MTAAPLSYDDVGDPGGQPVVYLHGFGDSRLSRHPDDGVAAALGVRLLAVDRAGFGASAPNRDGTYVSMAADVVALADRLGIGRFATFGWSSGAPLALAIAAAHPDRVGAVAIAAGNPPIEADRDPDVRAAMDEIFATRSELVAEMGAAAFAEMVAPIAAPVDVTIELAREHLRANRDAAFLADLDRVPGLDEQLSRSLVVATMGGLDGAVDDLRRQVEPWGFDLAAVAAPVDLWYGTADTMFRPAVGEWLAARLPNAHVEVVDGASHLLPFVCWAAILGRLAERLGREPKLTPCR